MATITETAHAFFEACETGKGWDACAPYCTPDATFSAQAEPLATVIPATVMVESDWAAVGVTVTVDELKGTVAV